MNILLVSDDHGMSGFEQAFNEAKKKYGTIDMVLHAGDTENNSNNYYREICECPFYAVCGNNDFNDNSEYIIIEADSRKIFLTHGHRYGVYSGMEKLYFAARSHGADIAVFGHTHRAFHEKNDSVEMINPGSLALPRGSRYGSYAVVEIDEYGDTTVKHFELKKN